MSSSLLGRHLTTLDLTGILSAGEVKTTNNVTVVKEYTTIVLLVLSDVDIVIDLNWSINGNQFAFDPNNSIAHTGDPNGMFYEKTIKGVFLQYIVDNVSAFDSTLFTIQSYARAGSSIEPDSPLVLNNIGSGEEILVSPDELKTLVSGDGSVTISSTADEVDLSVSSLAGSIWAFDPVGQRYYIPSIPGRVLIQDIGNNTFDLNSIGSQNYNGMYSGSDNTMIFQPQSGVGRMRFCTILGGVRNTIERINGSPEGATIVSGNNCTLRGNFRYPGIFCSEDSICGGAYSVYMAQDGLSGSGAQYSSVIGGRNNIIAGGRGDNIIGSNCNISGNGNLLLGDNNLGVGNTLTSVGNNAMAARFSNGYTFYSNATQTAGVALASGGSSWAPVSDENVKENIVRLDDVNCSLVCEKLVSMDVCKYNYIGNPSEQVCYGPTAQDWHKSFGCEDVSVPVYDYDENGDQIQSVDENGELLFDTKPAKDPLRIEMMDMMGVLMATVKNLHVRLEKLEKTL